MAYEYPRRRTVLAGLGGTLLASTLPFGRARAASPAVIGFIYVGARDDFGYNQAHAQGAAAVKKMPGIKVVEEETCPRDRRSDQNHGEHGQS